MEIIKGSYGYNINFTVMDEDDQLFDFSGSTVKLKIAKENNNIAVISDDCEIVGNGKCRYLIKSGDFDVVGTFIYQLLILGDDKKIVIDGSEKIHVKQNIIDLS
jgi:hypothetical protein